MQHVVSSNLPSYILINGLWLINLQSSGFFGLLMKVSVPCSRIILGFLKLLRLAWNYWIVFGVKATAIRPGDTWSVLTLPAWVRYLTRLVYRHSIISSCVQLINSQSHVLHRVVCVSSWIHDIHQRPITVRFTEIVNAEPSGQNIKLPLVCALYRTT